MPPTAVADKTLKGKGQGHEGKPCRICWWVSGVGHRWKGCIVIFAFVFSPKENVPGPRPTLTLSIPETS